MTDWIGQHIGAYEIVDLLGSGGMAEVYRARQLTIKREVAIKIIGARLADSPEFLKRFEREANTAANLNHAHIVKIFDYGEYHDSLYLVMELLSGGSLADRIRSGPLALDAIAKIVEQVGSALDYAHLKGIIHRDLKPQNVLFDESGDAHLSDFGIAKVVNENTSLTQSGAIIGTPAYMSPEQYRAETLDGRSDLYSFGVMLFEMLTGQAPFKADTPVIMAIMHLQTPPPKARLLRPDLPLAVEDVLAIALAKEPDKRYQSAGALASAFRAALSAAPPLKAPPPPEADTSIIKPTSPAESTQTRSGEPLATHSGRNRWLLVGAVVIAAALIMLVVVFRPGLSVPPSPSPVITQVAAVSTPTIIEQTAVQPSTTVPVVALASATTTPITPTDTFTQRPTVTPTATLPSTVTATRSPSPVPTTIDPSLLIAATINGRLTQTAIVVASYTHTATLTPSETPNIEQTIAAGVQMTDSAGTAIAVASFTKSPTPTSTATNTPIPPSRNFTATPTATPIPLTATDVPTATMTPVPVSSIVPGNVTVVYSDDFSGSTLSNYWSVDSNQHTLNGGVLSFDVNEKVSGKMDGLYQNGFKEGDGFLITFRYPAATPVGSIGFLGTKTTGTEAWALNMRASVIQSRTDDYFTSLRSISFTTNVWYTMLAYIDQNRTFYTYIWQRDKPTQYLASVNAKPPWTSPSWYLLLNEEGGKLDIDHYEQLQFPPGFVMPNKPPS